MPRSAAGDDDDLLARFNALRAPSHTPASASAPDPKCIDPITNAAQAASHENAVIEALSDGRPVSPGAFPLDAAEHADQDLARRMHELRGDKLAKHDASLIDDAEVCAHTSGTGRMAYTPDRGVSQRPQG